MAAQPCRWRSAVPSERQRPKRRRGQSTLRCRIASATKRCNAIHLCFRLRNVRRPFLAVGWCNDPARPYDAADTLIDLADYVGQSVQLRWRLTTDNSVGKEGWYVDDIRVQACSPDLIYKNGFDSVP